MQVEADAEEHDDQDDEDDEDTEEDEEDKGDGGTHATVVADLHETMKPQGERKALEKDKTRRTRRRRRRRRRRRPRRGDEEKNAEYLPATGTSEIKRNVTIGAGQEDQETLPQAARVKTYLCRWRAVSISNTCTQIRVGDEKNPTSIRIGELDIPATHVLVIPTVT